MMAEAGQKVKAVHLKRDAYLYIRQSTLRQVFENTESTKRQYALRQRAVALGWSAERVIVIDSDLGKSGSTATNRHGFQRLVAEVGMGRAGIVMGLEVSRLARNSTDWHRLLEICALTDTLILDEDGIYDPSHFNDRLLLGLKGTMSEAELHVLRMRLQGGIMNKARRGELKMPLPTGLVYEADDRVVLDRDKQVQESIRFFFETFRRTGAASATVKAYREAGLLFPRRLRKGPHKGDLVWTNLYHWRALQVLHNPRYAGTFVFGRRRTRKAPDGRTIYKSLPQEEWHTVLPESHEGYISMEQYQENQRRLRENAQTYGLDRRKSPPREGPALLQGLVICGICGDRMTVRYHVRKPGIVPNYMCQRRGIESAKGPCQRIPGAGIDKAIGELLVESMTPLTLEVALSVQEEIQRRLDEADRLRNQRVERARYEAEMARRRYMKVDPDNRLVADSLEADWNNKLRVLTQAQEEYERQREADRIALDEKKRAEVLALAKDFPRLWHEPKTPQRERKRMVRLMLEDVTLIKREKITVHVRFKGGAAKTLTLPKPLSGVEAKRTSPQVVAEIDQLLDHYTHAQIAAILNQRDLLSGDGKHFHYLIVRKVRLAYGLKSRYDRLQEAGMLTRDEIAGMLKVSTSTVKRWRRHGLLRAHAYNDRNEYLYEHPGESPPVKIPGRKLSCRRRFAEFVPNQPQEVQYEA